LAEKVEREWTKNRATDLATQSERLKLN